MICFPVSVADPTQADSRALRLGTRSAAVAEARIPSTRIPIPACRIGLLLVLLLAGAAPAVAADDPVFSGPQAGEKVVSFQARGAFGPREGKEFDPVVEADGKPLILIFVHVRTRPAFGLTNAVMSYAATRAADGLQAAIVFLPEDATETADWLKRVQAYFPKRVAVGISSDGQEGPGAYGLNRNVALTVLIAKEGKVTANFALVDPSLQADGPKIAEQIVKVLGSGTPPTAEELARNAGQARAMQLGDRRAEGMLRAILRPDAKPEDVNKMAEELQTYLKDKEPVRTAIQRTARQLVSSGRIKNVGTPAAREWIEKWANPR